MKENGTALAVARHEERDAVRAFEPGNMKEAYELSKILVDSGLMPKHVRTPQAAFAILAAGRELGLTALQSMRSIYFFEGKVTLSADLMVALVKRHPDCEYFRIIESTPECCACETKRRGEEPTRMTWTIDDGKIAGLLAKDNWRKYPKAMLRARVSADLCRAVYPDALMGTYDPDEVGPGRAPVDVEIVSPPAMVGGAVMAPPVIDVPAAPASEPRAVEAPPAPTPPPSDVSMVAGDEPSEEDRLGELALNFQERMHGAKDVAELLQVGKDLKAAKLPQLLAVPLREAYAARKKALEGGAK